MDTVSVQCGNCGKLMSLGVDQIREQVHCPHCRAVIEVDVPQNEPTLPEVLPFPKENAATSKIHTADSTEPTLKLHSGSLPDSSEQKFPTLADTPSVDPGFSPTDRLEEDSFAGDEPILTRYQPKRSWFVPFAIIFLIPYAIASTAFILLLLSRQAEFQNAIKERNEKIEKQNEIIKTQNEKLKTR